MIKNHKKSKKLFILWFVEGLQGNIKEFGEQIDKIKKIRNNVAHNKTIIFDDYKKNQNSLNNFLKNIRKLNSLIENRQFEDCNRHLEQINFDLIIKHMDMMIKRMANSFQVQ